MMLKVTTVLLGLFVTAASNKLMITKQLPIQDPCAEPLKISEPLDELNSTMKYYYDNDLARCFPYRSMGGYDGLNSFETERLCRSKCILEDPFYCGGNSPSTGACNSDNPNARLCPVGSFCKQGQFISMCCLQATEDAFHKEFKPKCRKGMTLVTIQEQYGEDALRGRNCSHNFCPDGTECRQGHWISHCCRKMEDEKNVPKEGIIERNNTEASTVLPKNSQKTTATPTIVKQPAVKTMTTTAAEPVKKILCGQ